MRFSFENLLQLINKIFSWKKDKLNRHKIQTKQILNYKQNRKQGSHWLDRDPERCHRQLKIWGQQNKLPQIWIRESSNFISKFDSCCTFASILRLDLLAFYLLSVFNILSTWLHAVICDNFNIFQMIDRLDHALLYADETGLCPE